MKMAKQKKVGVRIIALIVFVLALFLFITQPFALFGQQEIVYEDYSTFEFSDSNNKYCDGLNGEFDLITQQVLVTEGNYMFNLDTSEQPIALCDMGLVGNKYKYLGNNQIEVTEAGTNFQTKIYENTFDVLPRKSTDTINNLCSNQQFVKDFQNNELIFGETNIINSENEINFDYAVFEGDWTCNDVNLPYLITTDVLLSKPTVVYKIANFNGQTVPVNLKYAIPQTEIPPQLHLREYSCPLVDDRSLVSQTFTSGVYDINDFNVQPNFFCKSNEVIVSGDTTSRTTKPYTDLIGGGTFRVPLGSSYTLFYVTSIEAVEVPLLCQNVNILNGNECFAYLEQNIGDIELSIEEQIR
ncbi:MAG: hypothetical protein R3250_10370, partial [Melioribacteraceae bacterium]|nr:hypothetical protein [Melioribacteraceae bacterium]